MFRQLLGLIDLVHRLGHHEANKLSFPEHLGIQSLVGALLQEAPPALEGGGASLK